MSKETDTQSTGHKVGKGTAGKRLKRLWHQECFKNWESGRVQITGTPSLKGFAKAQVEAGNDDAQTWFDSKLGLYEAERSDTTKARIAAERAATKAAKRKTGKR